MHITRWLELHEAKRDIDAEIEKLLQDPAYGPRGFGVEFDLGTSLDDTAEEVAYGLGYEEGRGRKMKWTKDLLRWAKRKRYPGVLRMYKGGVEDGKAST